MRVDPHQHAGVSRRGVRHYPGPGLLTWVASAHEPDHTTSFVVSLRSLVPNVSYDAPTTVKVGHPTEFPDGLKFLADERLFVFREGNTFHVCRRCARIWGARCVQRRCRIPRHATSAATARGSHIASYARCHGSRYTGDGTNVAGPAPRPLSWFRLTVSPDDGQLVVDLADEVGHDFRLTVTT